jgi:Double-GTPase 2
MAIISGIMQVLATLMLIIMIAVGTILFYGLLLPAIYLRTMLRTVSARRTPEERNGTQNVPAADDNAEDGEDNNSLQDPEPEEPGGTQESIFIRHRVPFMEDERGPSAAGNGRPSPSPPKSDPGLRARLAGFFPAAQSKAPLPPQAGDRATVWPGHHVDDKTAIPSYFFGPLIDDMAYVRRASYDRSRLLIADGLAIIRERNAASGEVGRFGIMIGIYPGILLGTALAAAVAVAHLTVSTLTAGTAGCVAVVIRGADTCRRMIGGIKMTCPQHGMPIKSYPVYICPVCGSRHHDIRPGRNGIAWRICRCKTRLPTSLLLGTGTLAAECPDPDCGIRLPERFGLAAEIVIPIVGAGNAGKTQLMYRLYQDLSELLPVYGGTITLESGSKERLDRISAELKNLNTPSKTSPELPRAYVLHLTLGPDQRQIYLFDAAGELHYGQDRLRDLNYLGKARIMIFIADPLATDNVWRQLPAARRQELTHLRSRMSECDLAYQQTREHMRRMGSKRRLARLAFVVSKADLADQSGNTPGAGNQAVQEWIEDPDGLDMGNIVRESLHSFADVRFFYTSAAAAADGLPDESVNTLARWLLESEGIKLERGFNGS